MKISKSELKAQILNECLSELKPIIKECIKELVEEGVFSSQGSSSLSGNASLKEAIEIREGFKKNLKLEQDAINMARQVAKNGNENVVKLYEQIFTDTANTTLQERIAAEAGVGLPATPEVIKQDMAQLEKFEGSSRWAALALSPKSKSITGN